MKILVVSQYYYPEPFRINEICEELVRRGHAVTVLTANPNYPDGEIYDGYSNDDIREELHGVVIYRCKCRPRYKGAVNLGKNYLDFIIKANKRIVQMKGKYDCIYAYQLSPVTSCLPAIKYKNKYKIPMLLYCLDVWPESLRGTALENPLGLKLLGILSKYIYSSASKIVVTSPLFAKYLSNLCDIPESDIEYIPQHSIDIYEQVDRADLSNGRAYVNFMFAGNIGEAQNLESVIQAIGKLKNREKLRLHVIGSGSHSQNCIDIANRLGLSDVVLFYGRHPKSEMPSFYANADVCIVSLKDEGIVGNTIPGKVQEYMSAGKAILAYMNGDIKGLIEDAKCGICVPAEDENGLIKAMESIIEKKDLLGNMGTNARLYYQMNYTLDKHVDRLEELLLKLSRGGEKL